MAKNMFFLLKMIIIKNIVGIHLEFLVQFFLAFLRFRELLNFAKCIWKLNSKIMIRGSYSLISRLSESVEKFYSWWHFGVF